MKNAFFLAAIAVLAAGQPCEKYVCAVPSEYSAFNRSNHQACGISIMRENRPEIKLKPCGNLSSV